jgi:two-component system chemotaxis response regulator CheY
MPADRQIEILVVDDHQNMRSIIKNCLTQCGFKNLDFADDGTTALRKIKNQRFDLVLSDWKMDVMNGMELLERVRANPDPEISSVPILMVTAEASRNQVIEAIKSGANDYIVKPFQARVLGEKIDELFDDLYGEDDEDDD